MEIIYYIMVSLCNFVNVIVLYRFYNYIFNNDKYSQTIEMVSLGGYWITNTLIYFLINIPLVNLLINVLSFYFLTFNYRGQQKQKIFSAIFFCIALVFVETIVVFISTKVGFDVLDQNTYTLIMGHVFSAIFMYMFTDILVHRKNVNKQINLPWNYLLGLLVTPIFSFIIVLYMMSLNDVTTFGLSVTCILFLLINLVIFYLYDKIIAHVAQQKEHEILVMQNRDYHYMIENMRVSVENTRQLKHDLKNHAVVLDSLTKNEQYEELKDYLKTIFQDISGTYVETGNTTIDSILNFKIQECKSKDICFDPIVAVPQEMQISYDILTIVLGNLLDNAIDATDKLKEGREICFRLTYEAGLLYLHMSNPYRGTLNIKDGVYQSTKTVSEYHGYGLKNIQKAIDRNGGHMHIEAKDQRFTVNIVLATR